jgi:hypothetical protein
MDHTKNAIKFIASMCPWSIKVDAAALSAEPCILHSQGQPLCVHSMHVGGIFPCLALCTVQECGRATSTGAGLTAVL